MRKALLLVLILAIETCVITASTTDDDHLSSPPCRLYMGPSSLSTEDVPKLGLYAGIDYNKNDLVGSPGISVPLIDLNSVMNNNNNQEEETDDLAERIMDSLDGGGFLWTAEYSGSQYEGNYSVTSLIPGIGILANYHPGTHNIEWLQGSVLLREKDAIFEPAVSHPSRGAISTYNNLTMRASKSIKRGEELFSFMGDSWDNNKNHIDDDIYGDKLSRLDYKEADKIIDKFLEFTSNYEDQLTPKLTDDILDLILLNVLRAAAGNHAKVIRSLIPTHPSNFQRVKDLGGTFAYRNYDLIKTPRWLEKYAVCADNLETKPSTVTEAGRGAFATRNLKRGDVVAPVPTLRIADKGILDMFDIIKKETDDTTSLLYDRTKPRGQQLMINYCFSHPESSMVLFPISPLVDQINHAPPEKANARLTWSKNPHWGNSFDLHDMTPRELLEYNHVGIVLEIYALQDIEQGEEVFIDYGPHWEKAWKEHMRHYQESDSWPLRADDLKEEYRKKPFKTPEEFESDPYPEGTRTACFVETDEMTDGQLKVNDDDVDIALFSGPTSFEDYTGTQLAFCEVIDRKESDDFFYNYTILVSSDSVLTEIVDLPHAALTFLDLPYTSDIHDKNAFRHPIGIPDVIFPQAWRDKRG